MMWRIEPPTICVFLLLLFCAGCGGSKLAAVEGKVTLDGKPLSGVSVTFFPAGASVNDPRLFRGVTDSDGHYVLIDPAKGRGGAEPGKYRVTLTSAVAGPNDIETTPLPPERVPSKYRESSFEVPAGGTRDANFDMKSK